MLLMLLALTTALLESPIAALAFWRRNGYLYVLGVSALVNLLTNLLLNAVLLPRMAAVPLGALWDGWFVLLLGELVLAYGGEGLLYSLLTEGVTPGRGLLVSALSNTVSLGLGLGLRALLGTGEAELTLGFAVLCGIAAIFWLVCLAWGIRLERNR